MSAAGAAPGEDLPVGVVGGGLGGLAAAVTLAGRGRRVVVFERAAAVGGKASRLEADGFAFDVGPTILTLPSVLRRVFAEAGARLEDHLDLVPLDPQWRSFFPDGTTLDLVADRAAMERNVAALAGEPAARGYGRLLERAARLHRISDDYFFWRDVPGPLGVVRPRDLLRPGLLGDLLALAPTRTVSGLIRAHVPDARVAQMLDHFTQYVGSAPDMSPAVLCGIAHMQTSEGVWYPRGGTAAVPRALAALCDRLGVERRPGTGVRRILRDARGRACGVETDAGERVALAAVVSNADVGATLAATTDAGPLSTPGLLAPDPSAPEASERGRAPGDPGGEPACSGVVLYLGLERGYEHLLHHNFVFSADPEAELDAVYRHGEPPADPTCYVCAPARADPAVAPPGGEALYVLVHVPYRRDHHDWEALFPAFRRTILDKLARTAGLEDLERRIRIERHLTPAGIERRWSIPRGAIYGRASHGRLTGAFKAPNRCAAVPGLYLAGGSVHPGPGMPMALMSGWIAADALDRDARDPSGAGASEPLASAAVVGGRAAGPAGGRAGGREAGASLAEAREEPVASAGR